MHLHVLACLPEKYPIVRLVSRNSLISHKRVDCPRTPSCPSPSYVSPSLHCRTSLGWNKPLQLDPRGAFRFPAISTDKSKDCDDLVQDRCFLVRCTHSSSLTVTIWKPRKGIWIDVLSSFCDDTSSRSSMWRSSRSTMVALTTGSVVIKVALACPPLLS